MWSVKEKHTEAGEGAQKHEKQWQGVWEGFQQYPL